MGKGTMVGIGAGIAAIFICMIMEGGNPSALMAPPALILILVGSFGAACGGTSLDDALDALKSLGAAFAEHGADRVGLVQRAASYAEVARADGLLALEGKVADEEDPLLQAGMRLLVDGNDHGEITKTLQAMIITRKKAWDRRADFYNKMGGFGPTMGIIGTVLGLIHVLESLGGDAAHLGHLIAAAFIATFFGVMFANVVYLPIGAKFKMIGAQVVEDGQLVLVAVELLAHGTNPRSVRDRLAAYLPEDEAAEIVEPTRRSA
jgi:chemotaxis protein MotA